MLKTKTEARKMNLLIEMLFFVVFASGCHGFYTQKQNTVNVFLRKYIPMICY